jgi:hypothetical protein
MSNYILIGIIDFIGGFLIGGAITVKNTMNNSEVATKLSNVMNASMLDLVTKKIIDKEQVHAIEDVFHKHIEENFEHIKASHGDKE